MNTTFDACSEAYVQVSGLFHSLRWPRTLVRHCGDGLELIPKISGYHESARTSSMKDDRYRTSPLDQVGPKWGIRLRNMRPSRLHTS